MSTTLAELTTMRVGGEAETLVEASTDAELIDAALEAWGSFDPWLVLGGGSNVVVSDEGLPGTVIRVATRGIERLPDAGGRRPVRLRVAAGESWDTLVAHAVEHGWSGVEALSGIPGTVGASPIQNIGAYGQELASSLVEIEFLDFLTGEFLRIPAPALGLGYRTSEIKRGRAGVVVAVHLALGIGSAPGGGSSPDAPGSSLGEPVAYEQLAAALGVPVGERASLAAVRAAVLGLRAGKGMLVDTADPDSASAGSFFTNPIVSESFARALPADAPRWRVEPEEPERVLPLGAEVPPLATGSGSRVKLSAAWLIEHSGIRRGFALPGSAAAVSSKHTLAIVNRGGATATQIAQLATYIQTRVMSEFGVLLAPEPHLVGLEL